MPGRAHHARRALRWLAALVLVVLLVVCFALMTGPGLRLLLALGLSYYNGQIAGAAAVERVEGPLLGRFVLRGVTLSDRAGRPLVVADAVAVEWSPLALLRGELRIAALRLDGLRVHLVGDEAGGFGDLAPPDDEPEDMSLPPGPDLPLTIAVGLRLRDGAVYAADGAPLVEAAALDVDARGVGRTAMLEVTHGRARLAGTHPLDALQLRARWVAPLAALDDLRIRLAAAELAVPSARLDVRRLAGALRLRADASLAGLAAVLPAGLVEALRPLGPRVRLDALAEGVPEDMSAALVLALAPTAAITVAGSGAWRGPPRADLQLDADVDLAPWTGGRIGRVRPSLDLRARAREGDRVAVAGDLRCAACDGVGPVSADVSGVVDGPRDGLSLETSLALAGVSARVDLRARGGDLRALEWRLSAPALARPAAVARRFAPGVPAVAGALAGRGRCAGPELRCDAALDLRDLALAGVAVDAARVDVAVRDDMSRGTLHLNARGLRREGQVVERAELALAVRRAGAGPVAAFLPSGLPPLRADLRVAAVAEGGVRGRVDLSMTTGRELRAELRALELVHGGRALAPSGGAAPFRGAGRKTSRPGATRIALAAPAEIVVRERSLAVDHLRLDLGRGRLTLRGVADLDGASDIRLDVHDLELAVLRPLVPDLRPTGVASAAVRLRGGPEAPVLRADLVIARAGLRRRPIGDIDLSAHLAGGHATLDLDVRGPLARRAGLRAALPLDVNLSAQTWSIGHEQARADLHVADLRLRRLAPWIGGTALGGRVDGDLALAGDLTEDPRLTGEWRARDVEVDRVPVGDLDLVVRHRDDRLRAQIELRRAGGRARLAASVPLTLDPARGRFAWHRERDHQAQLEVTRVDLAAQLATLDPEQDVGGRLAARVALSGPATAPAIEAALRVTDLHHGRVWFGAFDLAAVSRGAATSLELAGGGPVGRLRLQALAPVGLDATGLAWRRDGWYALDVDLRGFELAALQPLVGVAAAGQVHAQLALAGPGPRPRAWGSVRADSLAYQDAAIGDLRAELGLHEGTATLTARGRLGRRGDLRLDACAPVDLDLGAATLAWSAGREGSLKLDLTGVDRSTVEPFYELPPDARLALDVHARADLDPVHVRGRAAVTGRIGRAGVGTAPLVVRLDVDDRRQTLRGRLGALGSDSRLDIKVDAAASMPAVRRGAEDLLATPIDGAVKARATDLRHVGGLLPTSLHDLQGVLYADLDLGGRVGRPRVRGEAHLRDGAVTVVPLQQRFRAIAVDLAADGPKLRLDRFIASSGEGRVQARGSATFAPGGHVTAEGAMTLRRFPVVRPGWPQVTVDTRVQAEVDARPDAMMVALTIPGAEVWVSDLTTRAPDPIPDNENVEILAGPVPGLLPARADERAEPAAADQEDGLQDMSLSVDLTQPVHIQGPSMDMRWAGKVTTRSAHGETRVLGEFRADRGRFELLGTDFRIEQGRVFLPPGGAAIDPYIDLAADARTPQADVTVTLRGRLSRPELRLRSQPPLTEPQIFALLLTGTVDSNETDPRKTQASAAGLLVNFTNPTLARFADQRLGIDRVKLGFADDVTQPVLTVGKYLSRSIYAETTYHHNAPPRHNRIEGQVEYRFAPGWSVETFFGDAAVGGLDVFWRRRFGGRRAPGPASFSESLFGHVP